MNTTTPKNKAVTSKTTKIAEAETTRTKADARAEAATDTRVTVGLGDSGVYGASDAFSVADATTAPQAPDTATP